MTARDIMDLRPWLEETFPELVDLYDLSIEKCIQCASFGTGTMCTVQEALDWLISINTRTQGQMPLFENLILI